MFKSVPVVFKAKIPISNISLIFNPFKSARVHSSKRELNPSILLKRTFSRHLSHLDKKIMDWSTEKEKCLKMSFEEKRPHYSLKANYVTLDSIKPWSEYAKNVKPCHTSPVCSKKPQLNEKVSIFVGDITALEIDAIVNAANSALRGGGGVDGAIHRAAGPNLLQECRTLKGCNPGEAKLSGGYKLPAKYVIQTVGPFGEVKEKLIDCYKNSLKLAVENNIRTIAFPCISTGVYHYPNENAAHVAIGTVREFLEQKESAFDRVIFCLFLPIDVEIYEALMQVYFPV